MGNRAVIAFEGYEHARNENCLGIYLHWNGGRDSVEAFIEYANRKQVRGGSYGAARLTQIICNYFGGNLSVGIDTIKNLDCDNYDNGLYWIDDSWQIVGREYFEGSEQKEYELEEFIDDLESVNKNHFQSEMR